MSERRFRYGPRKGAMILPVLLFGGCGTLFVYLALTGESVRLFPLPIYVEGPRVWGLAAFSLAFVVAALAVLVRSCTLGARELVVARDFLEFPSNPWTSRTVRIERARILYVRETRVAGTHVLEIHTHDGKRSISNRTAGTDGYGAVKEWLAAR